MSQWSVLVYSRTYEVDFRFLVVPEDFTAQVQNWAFDYIKVTTQNAEQIRKQPRWSIFANERYCIFGVTCMLDELIDPSDYNHRYMTVDQGGRLIYGFFGYVKRFEPQKSIDDVPQFSVVKDIAFFRGLAKLISDSEIWFSKPYEWESNSPFTYEYSIEMPERCQLRKLLIPLNRNATKELFVWTGSPQFQNYLWNIACQYACYNLVPFSLILGFDNHKNLIQSPFGNATSDKLDFTFFPYKKRSSTTNTSKKLPAHADSENINNFIKVNKNKSKFNITITNTQLAITALFGVIGVATVSIKALLLLVIFTVSGFAISLLITYINPLLRELMDNLTEDDESNNEDEPSNHEDRKELGDEGSLDRFIN